MNCNTHTLLVADADQDSRLFLAENLTADGYEVHEAASVFTARRQLQTTILDLAVVNLGFPDGTGLELVRAVRDADEFAARVDRYMPLVVMSSRSTEVERLRAFDRGADDFLARPYSYAELLARIRALLWRSRRRPAGARIRIGPLEVDPLARQAWLDGESLRLSAKEFTLLMTLASEPGRVFTRKELLEKVWGWGDSGHTRTLDAHASRLRRKLSSDEAHYVINVWGVGYKLIDVTAVAA